MQTVYDGKLHVSYRQFYVESRPEVFDGALSETRAGQINGLCGAAVPGHLFLTTGLHTGRVGLTVEVHDSMPPLDEAWEDVVEAPFQPASTSVAIVPWGDGPLCTAELPVIPHRVRYSASAMDLTVDQELAILDGGSIVDRYLLQFWPAKPAPDQVIKQTSQSAAYWHDCARSLPTPTPAEQAEKARLAELKDEAEREQRRIAAETREWGGRLPSDQLRRLGYRAQAVAWLDRDLCEAIAAADPDVQRSLARYVARCVYLRAGLSELPWVAPALDALDRGEPLPPPFDNEPDVWQTLKDEESLVWTLVAPLEGGAGSVSQAHFAIPALFSAVLPDPLEAALESLRHGTAAYGRDDYGTLLAEAWNTIRK